MARLYARPKRNRAVAKTVAKKRLSKSLLANALGTLFTGLLIFLPLGTTIFVLDFCRYVQGTCDKAG